MTLCVHAVAVGTAILKFPLTKIGRFLLSECYRAER